MNCSVLTVSRGRHQKLEYYLHKLYSMAKYPDSVETLIRVDDDDLETIKSFTPFFCGEYRKYIKMYSGPRFGANYLWMLYKKLAEMSSGKIIYPFADDCDPAINYWDEILLQYKDKIAVMGWKSRIAYTRLAFDAYEEVRTVGECLPGKYKGGDFRLSYFAQQNNFYYEIGRLYARVQPRDKTNAEATGGWRLKDLSILNNLDMKEIA